ncbi:hypothetical protein KIW84_076916 [Lathyrus oleraceus]|uniref:Retrovirus-related Pol polyprotein from transposon TNT 1-94-like beta-barrel domain-containing protein n=1 Tax=Pisum sativum TaxID=3888 RepID=A0A9D4VY44_PEA|nr:hypothetical protein KIW84_076916 [Pisum sativum]
MAKPTQAATITSFVPTSPVTSSSISDLSSSHDFCLMIFIKLHDNNYLLWNQQIEGLILTQRMHKLVVNPHIPQKFKTGQDRLEGKISEEYKSWIVQDQIVFIWLLLAIPKLILPRVLSFGDAIREKDQIDSIRDGLQDEYNPSVNVNVAHTNQQAGGACGGFFGTRGRGRMSHGRSLGRGRTSTVSSYHLTSHARLLNTKKPYIGHSRACVANGHSLEIQCVWSSIVAYKCDSGISLTLNDVLYVPCITRNLLPVSKSSSDNQIVCEFPVEGFLDKNDL